MAVYTTYTSSPQYYSGAMSGCLNGGEDYRTVNKQDTILDVNLAFDPKLSGLSKACAITSIKMSCQYRVTNTSNGSGLTLKGKFTWLPFYTLNPVLSGTSITLNSGGQWPEPNAHNFTGDSNQIVINEERAGNTSYASYNNTVTTNKSSPFGEASIIGAKFILISKNSIVTCRMWLKNVSFTITRTRACYITFNNITPGKNDSYTQKFDYGTVPEFKNVTADGYIFKGWKASNGTIYTTLPAAGEVDVTYTAVWELSPRVIYDSIFSFDKWAKTNLISNSRIEISDITNTGFTGKALVDDSYTSECRPLIPVEVGKEYTIEFEANGGNFELFVFNCDVNGNWNNSNPQFTMKGNTKKFNFVAVTNYISFRCDIVGTGTVVNFDNFRIYPADCPYMSNTVSASSRTNFDSWNMPTPTRNGYNFLGWYTQPNGGGTKYTSSSAFPTSDLVLYSHWELQKYTITFKNYDGSILQTVQVESNGIPSYTGSTPVKPSTAEYIYEFKGWSPSITAATSDATYTAQFDAIERKYEIVINPNGGIYNNSTDNTTVLAKYQSIINIDNPQKENNIFTHWNLSGTTPLKTIQTANGYTDYNSTNASTKFSHNLNQDETYTNYRWYDLSATSNAWNNLTFNTYSVSANETITITGYIRINGISAAQLNFYHGEKVNDYANNKFSVKNTNNEWKKFSFSRTFTTATDTAVFQIYTGNLANLTGEINFDLKEIQITRENGTILPTVIQINGSNLNLTANYREYQISFKSVKIYYPTDSEIASPNNPLISGEKAQIIVQVKLE